MDDHETVADPAFAHRGERLLVRTEAVTEDNKREFAVPLRQANERFEVFSSLGIVYCDRRDRVHGERARRVAQVFRGCRAQDVGDEQCEW